MDDVKIVSKYSVPLKAWIGQSVIMTGTKSILQRVKKPGDEKEGQNEKEACIIFVFKLRALLESLQ